MSDQDKLPEPSPQEQKEADKKIEDWFSKNGYPSPKPEKQ